MTGRSGQSSVEWVALLGVAGVIAMAVATGAAATDPLRLGTALQAAAGDTAVEPAPMPPGIAVADLDVVDGASIVEIARRLADSGVAEVPPGSNRGPGVDVFTGGRAEPWCADFVSWVLRAAGRPFIGGDAGWRLPWTGSIRAWFAVRGRFRERLVADPRPGDVVWFRHGHVGIVVAVRGSTLETVEGNAGDAVRTRTYPRWRIDSRIGGFGRLPAD